MPRNIDDKPLFIGLPMSRPRLLVPLASPRIQAFSFGLYNPGSVYGKIFKWFGRIAARVGLMKIFGLSIAAPVETFKATKAIQPILNYEIFSSLQRDWEKLIGNGPISIALSLGEPNPYRKITALAFDEKMTPFAFAKVGCTPRAGHLIANELMALEKIRLMGFRRAAIPKLLGYGKTGPAVWLLQTALLVGHPSPVRLKKEHIAFLAELAGTTRQVLSLESSDVYTYLRGIADMPILPIKTEFESERPFIEVLSEQFRTSNPGGGGTLWPFAAAHGDFAPWNIRIVDGRIALFDWEYFLPLAPAGWDVVYFIVRVEHLIKKRGLKQIWAVFETGSYNNILALFEKRSGLNIPDPWLLVLLVILAIALDSVPKWICGELVLESPTGS